MQALALWVMGRPLICTCGYVSLWYGNPAGPETSQQLFDWYSFTHVSHGLLFWLVLWLLAPNASFATRLLLAVGLEAGWEVAENTPLIIDLYRQSALALGYTGDSVVNSLADTMAAASGFLLAGMLPVWATVGLVVANEVVLAVLIHDNLMLNIIHLMSPHWALLS